MPFLLCGSRCAWNSGSSIHGLEIRCQRREERPSHNKNIDSVLPCAVLSKVLKCLLKIHSGGFPPSGGGRQVLGGGLESRTVETIGVLCKKRCPITFIFQEYIGFVQDSWSNEGVKIMLRLQTLFRFFSLNLLCPDPCYSFSNSWKSFSPCWFILFLIFLLLIPGELTNQSI